MKNFIEATPKQISPTDNHLILSSNAENDPVSNAEISKKQKMKPVPVATKSRKVYIKL